MRLSYPNILANAQYMNDMITDLSREKFPHTDILRTDEHSYTIVMSLAGYVKENISVNVEKRILTVEGEWKDAPTENDYVMHGISKRKFKRMFPLADHIEVDGVEMDNGLLYIDLLRSVPEKDQLKEFEIN